MQATRDGDDEATINGDIDDDDQTMTGLTTQVAGTDLGNGHHHLHHAHMNQNQHGHHHNPAALQHANGHIIDVDDGEGDDEELDGGDDDDTQGGAPVHQ